ncbi:nuclease domain-containing protein [Paraburkholderia phenoliruptrix]|uniref:nuclease domain-containing protein n=1 Tax=Paraburkholderia phenoliruptrix TaxID=252970 RepID=UPI001C6DDFA1|nr:nuclease domain-containing protein [Paraburkholderia phenoliruptrix]MBW9102934.1 DUF1364 family protein [Paraburkholderia phenoliruptrix]MBW9132908.1 DUF1364 family protein [Paraburkholderia ginsengiterrae]
MLKRKKPLVSKTPLQRTAPLGVRPAPGSSLTHTKMLVKSPMKRRPRKKRKWHDAKMRNACRNQICYLRVPHICPRRDPEETIVPAHSNETAHGKGWMRKTDDRYTVPACFWCHAWLDQSGASYGLKATTWRRGYREWSLVRDGVVDESVQELADE